MEVELDRENSMQGKKIDVKRTVVSKSLKEWVIQ
jgi:hypothetical protein